MDGVGWWLLGGGRVQVVGGWVWVVECIYLACDWVGGG